MLIKNSYKSFSFDKSACICPEVPILDFALSMGYSKCKFYLERVTPHFWQCLLFVIAKQKSINDNVCFKTKH